MKKKVDNTRIPADAGKGLYTDHVAVSSPWGKLMGYKDMMHYVARYNSVVTCLTHAAFRILMPDYVERTKLMCDYSYEDGYQMNSAKDEDGRNHTLKETNIPPFCRGNHVCAFYSDHGDERLLMAGRVHDFGSHRIEKELDYCDWSIVGSDLCRQTIATLQGGADALADALPEGGPRMEFSMVEAIGCGDLHCRAVAECRKKYPMPPRENWQGFGPIATEHLIRNTPKEDMLKEAKMFNEDYNFTYQGGTNLEDSPAGAVFNTFCSPALWYILPSVDLAIKRGVFTAEEYDIALRNVCEAAGKAAFGEFFAIEGVRQWLGAPAEVDRDDARLLGGYIEMYLQIMRSNPVIEAFNKDEVIYVVDRFAITFGRPKHFDALLYYWYGMSKTLLSPAWSIWEEDSPEGKIRIKIAKKIDKFC